MKSAYSAYRSANVDTADQGKLILIAYDVAIKHCQLSLEIFDDTKRIEERTKHIFKVQDAVTELMSSLNMEVGEISRNLYRLYEYMLHCLVNANVNSQASLVQEVLSYLRTLREAWNQAIQQIRQESLATDEGSGEPVKFAFTG